MARLLSKNQFSVLLRVASISRRSGLSCLTSSIHNRITCLKETHKCKHFCKSTRSGLGHSQFTNMQAVSEASNDAVNNWLTETEEIYCRLKAKADAEGWIQITNTNTDPKPSKFLYVKAVTENGPIIHYAMFVHKEKKKVCGICQFGLEAQGPMGLVHGGAIAAMHDAVTGVLASKTQTERCLTASLTVNYKNPTPLRLPMLLEGRIDKIERSKIFLTSYLKTPDGSKVYSDCSALYIDLDKRSGSSI